MSRRSVIRLLLLIVPVACVGILGRVYFTPDEPREGSLVATMASQANWALPELAGRPFAEKPPLLYWLGAASARAFGASPAAARAPNVLYLLVSALALATLAGRAAGPAAGFAAGIVAVTALQLYQVLIWLATDAPLVAGTALALLGGYSALTARSARERRIGYAGFYAGLAVAFFAKGFAGWLVPVPAFLAVIVLERRWNELWRAEIWCGTAFLALAIGAWVLAVERLPQGHESLKIMFWYNLVGRVMPLDVPPQYAYAAGHRNSFGKYLLELPLYLMPWAALAIGALRMGARGWRQPGPVGTAWRLGFGAIVPATILLSVAATARGIYYGPPALGFALLIGLYVGGGRAAPDGFDRLCWRVTGGLVALLAVVLGALAALVSFAPAVRDGLGMLLGGTAFVAALAVAWLSATAATAANAMPRHAVAVAVLLSLVAAALYRPLNDWQNLEALAARVTAAAGHRPLIVLGADETTLAMASLYVPPGELHLVLEPGAGDAAGEARAALAASGSTDRVLWLIPDRARWGCADWLAFLGYRTAPEPTADVAPPAGLGRVHLECVLVRPGGRSFALFASADSGGGVASATERTCL